MPLFGAGLVLGVTPAFSFLPWLGEFDHTPGGVPVSFVVLAHVTPPGYGKTAPVEAQTHRRATQKLKNPLPGGGEHALFSLPCSCGAVQEKDQGELIRIGMAQRTVRQTSPPRTGCARSLYILSRPTAVPSAPTRQRERWPLS